MGSGANRVARGRVCLYSVLIFATVAASVVPFAGRAAAASGNANLYLGKTVSAAKLTPALSLTLGVDKSSAIPGDTLTYTATLTNTGGVVSLGGDLTAYNQAGVSGQIAAYWDAFATSTNDPCAPGSTQGNNASGWTALAGTALAQLGYTPVDPAPLSTGLRLSVYPVNSSGVTYPSGGDPVLGTSIAAGATARWHYTAAISVTPPQEAFLLDPTKVTEERNTFHTEITPRVQSGNGQPNSVNTVFCDLLQPGVSGTVSNASVALAPPQGDPTVTFTGSTTPGLASVAPGAAVTVTYPWKVHVPAAKGTGESDSAYTARLQALEGAQLLATATAGGTAYGGAVSAGPALASTTEHVPTLSIAKGGPAVAPAGSTATYPVNLANSGGAMALALSITDAVPSGSSATVTGTPSTLAPSATGSATASYPVPVSQPCGPLSDTAAVTWQDGNANAYGPVSSSFTTTVTNCFAGSSLTLSPTMAGPDVTGTSQMLKATFLSSTSQPISGQSITFSITGANPTSGTATTDQHGVASFSYVGNNRGTDTAQASFTSGAFSIQSNTATISWVTPVATVSTTTVHGVFFAGGCGSFCHAPGSTPAFSQDFPTIDFNPPGGTIPGNNTGVTVDTRPFTDITTDVGGNFSGSVVAQGNGVQAGTGNLFTFDAVFTAQYVVAQPGNVTFNFYSDDGFIFGVGGGATRVSGPMVNAPSTTPFQGYPVMGAYNQPTSPVANSITVNFPAAGTYPYEADYSECCGGQVAFTMASSSTGHGVPPAGNLTLTPQNAATQAVGQAVTLTASAMDASGQPVGSLPVTLTVAGPNSQQLSGTTNAQGLATFTYVGSTAGTDQDEVGGNLSGLPAVSNIAVVPWAFSVPGQSSGSSTAPPPSITAVAPADGTVVTKPTPITGTVAPPAGQSIVSWTVTYQALDPGPVVTLASGSGAPPSPIATFDPTLLPNDTYAITVTATASGGGSESTTTTVAVAGNLKLGRFTTAYSDISVPVNGQQMQVLRTYDSLTANTVGDFGHGWHVSVSNFRTVANRALGAGGWTEYTTSCFILCNYAFRTSVPHFATVTFPDNHQEAFDFTPNGPGPTLIDFAQGTAAFTARSGTTSTLAVTDPSYQGFSYGFDGNLYDGSGHPYSPTRYTLTTADHRVFVLDVTTGLVSESDPNGNSLTVNASGVHSSAGQSITIARDAQGRITDIYGPANNGGANDPDQHLHYDYTSAGDLSDSMDADGNMVTYTYGTNHELTTAMGPGQAQPFQRVLFDSSGRVTDVIDAAGNDTRISNNVSGQQQIIADPNGTLSTVDTFDDIGDLVQEDQVFNGQTATTTWTYDASGRVTSRTDPMHHQWAEQYDTNGNPAFITDPNGHSTYFTYTPGGLLTSIQDTQHNTIASLTYDPAGNLTQVQRADGSTLKYGVGSGGQLSSVSDASGRTTAYGYDAGGRVNAILDPAGKSTSYVYDASGRLLQETDPDGNLWHLTYDANGNIASIADSQGHTRSFIYDDRGNVTSEKDGDGVSTMYTYDATGQVASVSNRDHQTLQYAYNADGQLTRETTPTGTKAFTYDALGELLDARNADADVSFTYDASGAVLTQQTQGTATSPQPSVTLSYTYDGAGNQLTVSGPDGITTYGYDNRNRLTSILDPVAAATPGGQPSRLGYDAASRLSSLQRPNGINDTYAYQGDYLSGIASSLSGSSLQQWTYGRDGNGQVSNVASLGDLATVSRDNAGQLTSVTHTNAALGSESYSFDSSNDRVATASAALGSVRFDAADRVTADPTATYAYNGEGDMVSRTDTASGGTTHYNWNADHQLTSIAYPDGSNTSYRYDTLGRRIEVNDGGQITRYVYDGDNIHLEYDGTNTLVATYVNGLSADTAVEMVRGGQPFYYLRDGLGSIAALTDAAGHVVDSYNYDSFGQQTATGTVSNPFSFTGREFDKKSGLYYYRDRYYDPRTGTFLSEDPLATGNPYIYARNDPRGFVDPSGDQAVVEYNLNLENKPPQAATAEALGERLTACLEQCAETFAANVVTAAAAQGGVYVLTDSAGDVVRTGRTNNLAAREAQHRADFPDLTFEAQYRTNDYSTQRGLEQGLFDKYFDTAHVSNGGFNRIRSISVKNRNFARYVDAACGFLAAVVSS